MIDLYKSSNKSWYKKLGIFGIFEVNTKFETADYIVVKILTTMYAFKKMCVYAIHNYMHMTVIVFLLGA